MASKESDGRKTFPRSLLLNFRKGGKYIPLFSTKNEDSECNPNRPHMSELNEGSNDIFLDTSVTNVTVSVSKQIVDSIVVVTSSVATQHDSPSNCGSAKSKSLKSSVSDVGKEILGKFKHRNKDHESTKSDNAAGSKLSNDSTRLVSSKLQTFSKRKEKHKSKIQHTCSVEQNKASVPPSSGYRKLEKCKNSSNRSFKKKEKTKKFTTTNTSVSDDSTPNKVAQLDGRISPQVEQEVLPDTEKLAVKSSSYNCSNSQPPETVQDLPEGINQISQALCANSIESLACICDCKNTNSTTACCEKRKTPSPYHMEPEVIPDKVLRHQSCKNRKSPAPGSNDSTFNDTHNQSSCISRKSPAPGSNDSTFNDTHNQSSCISRKSPAPVSNESTFNDMLKADNTFGSCVKSIKEKTTGTNRLFPEDHLVGAHDCGDDCCDAVYKDHCDEPTAKCKLCDDSDCSDGQCSDLDCSCCDQTRRSQSDTEDITSSNICSDSVNTASEANNCDIVFEGVPGQCLSKYCSFKSNFQQENKEAINVNDCFDMKMSLNSVTFTELDIGGGEEMSEQFKDIWTDSPQTLLYNRRYTSLCATPASSPALPFCRHKSMTMQDMNASFIGNRGNHVQSPTSSLAINFNDRITKATTNKCLPYMKEELSPNHSNQSVQDSPNQSSQSVESSPTPLNLSQNSSFTNVSSDGIVSADNSPTQNCGVSPVSSNVYFASHNASKHIKRPQFTAASPERNCSLISNINSSKLENRYSSLHSQNNSFSCHNSILCNAISHSNFAVNKLKSYKTSLNRSNSSFESPNTTFSRGDSRYTSFHDSSQTSPLDLSHKTYRSMTKGRTGKRMKQVGHLLSPAGRVLHKNPGLSEKDLCKQILDLYVSDAEESGFDVSVGVDDSVNAASLSTSFSEHEVIGNLGSYADDSMLQYGTYVGPRNVERETNVDDFITSMVQTCYSGQAKTRRLQGGPSSDLIQEAVQLHCSAYQDIPQLQSEDKQVNWEINEDTVDLFEDVPAVFNGRLNGSRKALLDKTNSSQALCILEPSCDKSLECLTKLHTACNGLRKVRCLSSDKMQSLLKFHPPKEASRITWGQTLNEMDLFRHSPRKTPVKTRPILAQKENSYPCEEGSPSPIVLTKISKRKTLSKTFKNWPWS